MRMEAKCEVVTTIYDTIAVSDGLTVDFEKNVSPSNTIISGVFKKSNETIASLSYQSVTGKYKLDIPKFGNLTSAEFKAIHLNIPDWIEEINS